MFDLIGTSISSAEELPYIDTSGYTILTFTYLIELLRWLSDVLCVSYRVWAEFGDGIYWTAAAERRDKERKYKVSTLYQVVK